MARRFFNLRLCWVRDGLVSVGSHLAIVLALLLLLHRAPEQKTIYLVPVAEVGVARPSSKSGKQKVKSAVSNSISRFGLNFGLTPQQSGPSGAAHSGLEAAGNESGLISGLTPADSQAALYRYLYEKIDENLAYPIELSKAGIQGEVQASLAFSSDGVFIKERSRVESPSSFLRVLVWRALRKAFREGIPASLFQAGKELMVQCRFNFEQTVGDIESHRASRKIVSARLLAFYRNVAHTKLEWEIGPLSGMLPIPSAALNLGWFKDKYEQAIQGHAKIDPLDSYRNDPEW